MKREEAIEKAGVLLEAIPFIRKFSKDIIVIKYGGSAMTDEKLKESVTTDIAMLKYLSLKPVIVHGGGKEISSMLKRMGKESVFVDGLRVTDKETAKVAEMILSGSIAKSLVESLEAVGVSACAVSGKDGHTLMAKKLVTGGVDLGFVGDITKVNTNLINTLIDNDYVPVISPVGVDEEGNTYNINADYAASAVAGALAAEKLIFLTDVEGVLSDVKDPSSIIGRMTKAEAEDYIADGVISGGMIPKVECCLDALSRGVKNVHVLNGCLSHSILLEIFTTNGIGTMVTKGETSDDKQ
jgi:acetylglutamate kinase